MVGFSVIRLMGRYNVKGLNLGCCFIGLSVGGS